MLNKGGNIIAGKQFTDLTKASDLKDIDIIAVHDGNGLKKGLLSQLSNYIGTKFSNPNLLINPDFKINQRGGSTYSIHYSVDRWKIYNALYDVSTKNLSNPNSSDGNFVQTFENHLNGTYTITAHCSSVTGKANFTWGGESVIVKEEVVDLKEGNNILTIKATDLKFIGVLVKPGASVNIDYIKLEQGSVATPFIAPNPAEELVKCQRYYFNRYYFYVFYSGSESFTYIFSDTIPSMRIKPTVNFNNTSNSGLTRAVVSLDTTAKDITLLIQAVTSKVGNCNVGGTIALDAEIY